MYIYNFACTYHWLGPKLILVKICFSNTDTLPSHNGCLLSKTSHKGSSKHHLFDISLVLWLPPSLQSGKLTYEVASSRKLLLQQRKFINTGIDTSIRRRAFKLLLTLVRGRIWVILKKAGIVIPTHDALSHKLIVSLFCNLFSLNTNSLTSALT